MTPIIYKRYYLGNDRTNMGVWNRDFEWGFYFNLWRQHSLGLNCVIQFWELNNRNLSSTPHLPLFKQRKSYAIWQVAFQTNQSVTQRFLQPVDNYVKKMHPVENCMQFSYPCKNLLLHCAAYFEAVKKLFEKKLRNAKGWSMKLAVALEHCNLTPLYLLMIWWQW